MVSTQPVVQSVHQFLDGDRFIKYENYINWGLWAWFIFIDLQRKPKKCVNIRGRTSLILNADQV